jgi:hypothetical protein
MMTFGRGADGSGGRNWIPALRRCRRTGEDEQNKTPLATADVGDSIRQAWMSDRTFCIS